MWNEQPGQTKAAFQGHEEPACLMSHFSCDTQPVFTKFTNPSLGLTLSFTPVERFTCWSKYHVAGAHRAGSTKLVAFLWEYFNNYKTEFDYFLFFLLYIFSSFFTFVHAGAGCQQVLRETVSFSPVAPAGGVLLLPADLRSPPALFQGQEPRPLPGSILLSLNTAAYLAVL